MRKKICIGLLVVLLGTGLGAMLVNRIWEEPKQGVDLGTTQMIVKDLWRIDNSCLKVTGKN